MKMRSLSGIAVATLIVVAACTPTGASPAPTGTGQGGTPAACQNKVGTGNEIHIYSSLPRQGTSKAQTDSMVEQFRAVFDGQTVGGKTIKFIDKDDSSAAQGGDWDGAVAQANATEAANDPDAMIFIGHYNSGAAKLTIPILNGACLAMISPANTYPGLTKAVANVTEPNEPNVYYPGGFRNYARVISTDDAQGAAGAAWAKELGATKAYVLDDTQVYGKGLARSWAVAAAKLGITIVSSGGTSEGYDKSAPDYAALADKIKNSGADFIYVGAITGANTGKLWKDLRAAMPDIKIMSGDGVFEKSWYDGTGEAGNGTYLTFGGVGPDEQGGAAAKAWLADYKASHNGEAPPVYALYGRAAAEVALDALKRATNPQDRYAVLQAVFSTNLDSTLGQFTFNANGDTTLAEATGYQVETSWPPKFEKVLAAEPL